MKKLLMLSSVFFSTLAQGQQYEELKLNFDGIAYKDYSDSTGNYLVKYNYDPSVAMIPATYPPGEPHYFAKIEVYQLIDCKCFVPKYDTVLVGKPMMGQYVKNGCFEDAPSCWVKMAKSAKLIH